MDAAFGIVGRLYVLSGIILLELLSISMNEILLVNHVYKPLLSMIIVKPQETCNGGHDPVWPLTRF